VTSTSATIESLLSYSWNDWVVTQQEMRRIVTALGADPSPDATIKALHGSGGLLRLYVRVDEPGLIRQVVAVVASRAGPAAALLARKDLILAKVNNPVMTRTGAWSGFPVEAFFDICHNLGRQSNALGFALQRAAPGAPVAAPASSASPFSGVGATGRNPTTHEIGVVDKLALAANASATVARYSNPIPGSLRGYLATLSPSDKLAQARTLVRQPISSVFPAAYPGGLPQRAQVMSAAGALHQLEPELVAAIILAEQRDQSGNEDAKDYVAATSLLSGNTSIGLGQVVVSTARKNDLFADLLSLPVRKALAHDGIATLLASDEFNIFATARYIRQVADDATRKAAGRLAGTLAAFPAMRLGAYGGHSSTWPRDNVLALGSEYTSSPWDDRLSTGWADFVGDAYDTFKSSGIVFP
jgi:hypothetical protein